MAPPRVLFVSKAVAAPFHDGAACIVRDLCDGLSHVQPTVMTTRSASAPSATIRVARVYPERSRFAPAMTDNARVFGHVLRDRAHDLWHFVFAPNPVSSRAGALIRALRRTPIVQTVASQPRSFVDADRLLFGHRIAALSRFTADRLIRHGADPARIEVIPPPVRDINRTQADIAAAKSQAGLHEHAPTFIYPGDLEFSRGSATVAAAAQQILQGVPDAQLVFACRAKTEKAQAEGARLAAQLRTLGQRVRFVGEVADLPALLAGATAVLFPVDDLYGKVDLPYAVLEAALLRTPVIVANTGPLSELKDAPAVDAGNATMLAERTIALARDDAQRRQIGQALRDRVLAMCSPRVVASAYESLYLSLVAT